MAGMRGDDRQPRAMFSYVSAEERVPLDHPLRAIRTFVDEILREMTREFDALYAQHGRPSIPPERLLRAQLLQLFYSIRSERLLMEQLDYNILFRWFVGLEMDEPIWVPRRCSPRTAIGCCSTPSPTASSSAWSRVRPT
jgi:transposase